MILMLAFTKKSKIRFFENVPNFTKPNVAEILAAKMRPSGGDQIPDYIYGK